MKTTAKVLAFGGMAAVLALGGLREARGSEGGGWLRRDWTERDAASVPRVAADASLKAGGAARKPAGTARAAGVAFGTAGLAGGLPAGDGTRIEELARGLDHDWQKCFDYVRNHIAFTPYPGFMKGPERTLLDREGNDADQALLLCALLRASGFPSATVVYEPLEVSTYLDAGFVLPLRNDDGKTPYNARDWLGVDDDGTAADELNASGIPVCFYGYDEIAIPHYWATVQIDGETVHLDPSVKPQPETKAKDAASASGYDRAALLSAAGGTVGANSVKGLSEENLGAYLTARTAALKAAWTEPGASPRTVLGGRSIAPRAAGEARFNGEWASAGPVDVLALPAAELNARRTPVKLTAQGGSFTDAKTGASTNLQFYLDEVGSRTLWFAGDGTGALGFYADDAELARTTALDGWGEAAVQVDAGNPGMRTVATYDVQATNGMVNVLGVGFGADSHDGIRRVAGRKMSELRGKGLDTTAPRALAAALQMQAQEWFSQVGLHERVWNRVVGARRGHYYNVGMAGQNTGPFVDMANAFRRGRGGKGLVTSSEMFSSALEHSVIEQLNGADLGAVSTARLLTLANGAGGEVFFMSSANSSAVLGSLANYSSQTLADFRSGVANGTVYLLPRDGNVRLNDWVGTGYVQYWEDGHGASTTGMIIHGGLRGGFLSKEWWAKLHDYIDQKMHWGDYRDSADGNSQQGDPVAMPSGAFLDEATDLALRRAWPLAWTRNYDSLAANGGGDLGRGWSHGFEARVTEASYADAALDASSLGAVLPTVVASMVAEDLMGEVDGLSAGEIARRWTLAAMAATWWTKQLPQASVTVSVGTQTLSFQKMPDGTYEASPGVTATLERDSAGRYTLRERLGNAYAFDADGRLATITDPNGNVTRLEYVAGLLSRVVNPFDAWLDIERGTDGRISRVTDSSGKSVRYAYDAAGCLVAVTDAAGEVWRYEYDAATHAMTAKKDPLGNTLVQNRYNALGQVVEQTAANGKIWRYGYAASEEAWNEDPKGGRLAETYDGNGRVLSRTGRDGAVETTAYDGHGKPSEAVDAAGTRRTFAYDARDNLLAATESGDGETRTTRFGYDAQDRLVAATNALRKATRLEYDARHRVTKTTDADGTFVANTWNADGTLAARSARDAAGNEILRTVYEYGPYGLETKRTVFGKGLPSAGVATETEYEADGAVAAVTDARGYRTTFAHDAAGRLVKATDALGNSGTIEYDRAGRVVARTDALGRTTRTGYTASGMPETTTYADGSATRVVYDEVDDVLETVDARGAKTTFERDAAGRAVATADALGNVARVEYDTLGRPVWMQDGAGDESRVVYDAFGRAVETIDGAGAVWKTEYDKLDRPVVATSPLGQVTRTAYDAVGRVTKATAASGSEGWFGYDGAGNQAAYTNEEGHVHTMAYDALGRLVAETNALGKRVLALEYDANGNVTRAVDGNGAATVCQYDALDRLVRRDTSDDTAVLSYDAVGNLVAASNRIAVETFAYDAMDRLAATTAKVGRATARFVWQRDAGGLATNVDYGTGFKVARTYDALGRVAKVDAGGGRVWTFEWDGVGRLAKMTNPDGRTSLRSYDAAGRLASWNAGEIAGRELSYDAAGRKTNEVVTAGHMPVTPGALHAALSFDAAGRPTEGVVFTGGTEEKDAFEWDGNGSLTRAVADGGKAVAFRYNGEGALAAVSTDGAEDAFAYDALENRVRAGGRVWFADPTDPLKRPLLECGEDGTIVRAYVWEGAMLLGYVGADGSLVVAHAGEQGGVIALSRQDGTVIHSAVYGPHGENWGRWGDNPVPFAWLGGFGVQRLAAETFLGDLYLTRHRLYSPQQQRFLASDPLGLAGGLNLYAYGDGNPLAYVDPLGLCSGKGDGWTRLGGFFQVIGGIGEMIAGGSLVAAGGAASSTGAGAIAGVPAIIGGVAVTGHGLDQVVAGLRKVFTGQDAQTLTSYTIQKTTGMNRLQADITDGAISIVGTLGASGFATTLSKGTQAANAASATGGFKPPAPYYPPNNGFVKGTEVRSVSTEFQRIGKMSTKSDFVAPVGTKPGNLSLPPGTDTSKVYTFTSTGNGVSGTSGKAMSWWGQPGGGTQIKLDAPILEQWQNSGTIIRTLPSDNSVIYLPMLH